MGQQPAMPRFLARHRRLLIFALIGLRLATISSYDEDQNSKE